MEVYRESASQLAQLVVLEEPVVMELFALTDFVARWEVVCLEAEARHATFSAVQGIETLMVIALMRESFARMALIMTEIC